MLDLYRNYLAILAGAQLDRRLLRRVGPSDLVQETLLAAHRDFRTFRGRSEQEFLAWLRRILIHCLHEAVDVHLRARKRDLRREISLDDQAGDTLERSWDNLGRLLADPGPSPSAMLRRRERAVVLSEQLARLKPEYRDVIVLRNLQGLSFVEVAERMERKPGTVRMLWLRAIEKLRELYNPGE